MCAQDAAQQHDNKALQLGLLAAEIDKVKTELADMSRRGRGGSSRGRPQHSSSGGQAAVAKASARLSLMEQEVGVWIWMEWEVRGGGRLKAGSTLAGSGPPTEA